MLVFIVAKGERGGNERKLFTLFYLEPLQKKNVNFFFLLLTSTLLLTVTLFLPFYYFLGRQMDVLSILVTRLTSLDIHHFSRTLRIKSAPMLINLTGVDPSFFWLFHKNSALSTFFQKRQRSQDAQDVD